MVVSATEPLTLKVVLVGGDSEQDVTLAPNEYYLNERGFPVIYHDHLQNLADRIGGLANQITTAMELGVFNSYKSFCFVYRAQAEIEGRRYDEVGEANPANLASNPDKVFGNNLNIGFRYPAIMADKRAKDRLLIRLLGLKGQIMSDIEMELGEQSTVTGSTDAEEVPVVAESKPADSSPSTTTVDAGVSAPASPAPVIEDDPFASDSSDPFATGGNADSDDPFVNADSTDNESAGSVFDEQQSGPVDDDDAELTALRALPVAFGQYKNNPTTLGNVPVSTLKWLAGVTENGKAGFQVSNRSSQQMKDLNAAAKILLEKLPA